MKFFIKKFNKKLILGSAAVLVLAFLISATVFSVNALENKSCHPSGFYKFLSSVGIAKAAFPCGEVALSCQGTAPQVRIDWPEETFPTAGADMPAESYLVEGTISGATFHIASPYSYYQDPRSPSPNRYAYDSTPQDNLVAGQSIIWGVKASYGSQTATLTGDNFVVPACSGTVSVQGTPANVSWQATKTSTPLNVIDQYGQNVTLNNQPSNSFSGSGNDTRTNQPLGTYSFVATAPPFYNCSVPSSNQDLTGGNTVTFLYICSPTLPTASLTADSTSIRNNETTNLNYTGTNAQTCTITPAASLNSPINTYTCDTNNICSGTVPTTKLNDDTTYTLTCTNPNGSSQSQVTVFVGQQRASCTSSFDPSSISQGGITKFTWQSDDADNIVPFSCTGDLGSRTLAGSGSLSNLMPQQTQTCTLTVENSGGQGTCSAAINVTGTGPLPPPTHNECVSGTCTVVEGTGADNCSPAGSACPVTEVPGPFTANTTVDSCSQIRVSWSASLNATTYHVLRKKSSDASYTELTTAQPYTALNYTDTGLSQSTAYNYRVTAQNSSGTTAGTPDPMTNITPNCPIVEQPPPGGPVIIHPSGLPNWREITPR